MKRSEAVKKFKEEHQRIIKENVLFGDDVYCELLSFAEHVIGLKPSITEHENYPEIGRYSTRTTFGKWEKEDA